MCRERLPVPFRYAQWYPKVNPRNRKDLRGLLPILELTSITGNRIGISKVKLNILTGMTAFTC